MNILRLDPPDISENINTSLTQQANAGDTVLNVVNTKGFSTNQILLVGSLESENAEVVKTHATTSPTDTQITLASGLKFSHTTDEPVTILDFDKIEIYRASAKGGDYSLIDTIDIDYSEEKTIYRDTYGTSTSYYKIRYKNSIDSTYSDYSAEFPASGFPVNSLYAMVEKVLTLFSSQSERLLNREEIIDDINEGYRILVNKIIDLGIDYYVKKGDQIPLVANQEEYILPSDFVRPKRIYISYDGSNEYPAEPMDFVLEQSKTAYLEAEPKYFFRGEKIVIRPVPTSSTGYIQPYYYYMPNPLENDDDEPELPKGYHNLLVNYALARAFEKDKKIDWVNYYMGLFTNQTELMLLEIKKRTPERGQRIVPFGWEYDDNYPFY
jgi:hypothetical protein